MFYRSLADILVMGLDLGDARDCFRGALRCLHENRLYHSNLKARNTLYNSTGPSMQFVDFGEVGVLGGACSETVVGNMVQYRN